MSPKKLLPPFILLALLGTGYLWWKNTQPPAVKAPNPVVTAPADDNRPRVITGSELAERQAEEAVIATEGQKASSPSSALFTVDDTWQTYQNKSLNFEFRWPTKGIYAPTWEEKTLSKDDPSIQASCAAQGGLSANAGPQGYCHSTSNVEVTDTESRVDQYVWKQGDYYVVIIFTKKLYHLPACKSASLSKNTCIAYKPETYQALLDTIVSTAKLGVLQP